MVFSLVILVLCKIRKSCCYLSLIIVPILSPKIYKGSNIYGLISRTLFNPEFAFCRSGNSHPPWSLSLTFLSYHPIPWLWKVRPKIGDNCIYALNRWSALPIYMFYARLEVISWALEYIGLTMKWSPVIKTTNYGAIICHLHFVQSQIIVFCYCNFGTIISWDLLK